MPTLSDDRYKKIIEDYESGLTQKQAGTKNGIGRDAVGNILRRFGIPIREYTGERKSNQQWEWNRDFFCDENPVSSYWAGFLIADGNINDRGNVMALVIQGKDIEHLYSFCDDIGLSRDAIFKDSKYNAYGIHIHSKNLGRQLETWGITPRKSKHFTQPVEIPFELLPHFLRGWIDGDGNVYRYGRASRIRVASGNRESLDWFSLALRYLGYDGNISIYEVNSAQYPGNYMLYIGGARQVAKVCDLLLVDEYFCMKRKWTSRRD